MPCQPLRLREGDGQEGKVLVGAECSWSDEHRRVTSSTRKTHSWAKGALHDSKPVSELRAKHSFGKESYIAKLHRKSPTEMCYCKRPSFAGRCETRVRRKAGTKGSLKNFTGSGCVGNAGRRGIKVGGRQQAKL